MHPPSPHIFSLNAQTPHMLLKWCDFCLSLRLDKHARLSLPHFCGDAIVPVFNICFFFNTASEPRSLQAGGSSFSCNRLKN